MTTHWKGKRTFEDIVNKEIDWLTMSIVNDMLKEAGIDAKFETHQETTKEGEGENV